jgi:hypothetical protein
MTKRIAIIGAGLSGLTLANRLQESFDVVVFEKARGVGGRMSTRYSDPFFFDHGTQFFTARTKLFQNFLKPHLDVGLVQEWKGKAITLEQNKKITDRLWFEPHYVASPSMNSLCKSMAEGLSIILNCEIAPLAQKESKGWEIISKDGASHGFFDLVISTAPPIQTARLFQTYLPPDTPLLQAKFLACYTMMFGFNRPWDQPWIAAKILDNPLEWVAVNSTKPGRRKDVTTLVIHSSNSWAEDHCDDALKAAEDFLRSQLQDLIPLNIDNPDYFSLHRWRYALNDKAHDDASRTPPYYDPNLQLASVSDWGSRSRIEDVWLEANRLADTVITTL